MYIANHFINRVPSYYIRNWFYRNIFRVKIGRGTAIHMGLKLFTIGGIEIGENCVINRDCLIDGRGSVKIGENVNISPEVMIWTADHDPKSPDFAGRIGNVNIGDFAWLSTRSIILPGVIIGTGSVVAAGAVVTSNVSPYSIVAGVPARRIGERARNLSYRLNYSPWLH